MSPPNGRMMLAMLAIARAATMTRSGWFFLSSILVTALLITPMNAAIAKSPPMVAVVYPCCMSSKGIVMSLSAQYALVASTMMVIVWCFLLNAVSSLSTRLSVGLLRIGCVLCGRLSPINPASKNVAVLRMYACA